jgi:hypothetical protein
VYQKILVNQKNRSKLESFLSVVRSLKSEPVCCLLSEQHNNNSSSSDEYDTELFYELSIIITIFLKQKTTIFNTTHAFTKAMKRLFTSISILKRPIRFHERAIAASKGACSCSHHGYSQRQHAGTTMRRLPLFLILKRDSSGIKKRKGIGAVERVWEVPARGSSAKEKLYESCISSKRWTLVSSSDKNHQNPNEKTHVAPMTLMKSLQSHTIKHLMPNNYPSSVHSSYLKYATFSFIANTASTATMVLSTQSLLLAIGVGQHAVAPISATLNWILKDGIGQFGGILFASKISSSSSSVDADPKRWRMVSSLAMDCAMMMELMTPAFPGYFLFIASAANIGKNIAFLTASASRAKLHQCLASRADSGGEAQNLGDITGKATSQSILASLAGTGIGIGLSPYLLHDLASLGLGCIALSVVNQVFTYQSLKDVPVDNLNRQRLMILMELYFEGMHSHECDLTPENVAKLESFVPLLLDNDSHKWLYVGSSISTLAPNGTIELSQLHQGDDKYILNYETSSSTAEYKAIDVHISFLNDAVDEDILRGIFQAYAVRSFAMGLLNLGEQKEINQRFDIITSSHRYMDEHFEDFQTSIKNAGWAFDNGKTIVLESSSDRRLRFEASNEK